MTDQVQSQPEVTQPVKPGYLCTEWYLTLAAYAMSILFMSGLVVDGSSLEKVLSIVAAALAGLGYSVSRGLAKKQ